MKTSESLKSDVPLYSPCRNLTFNAPFRWLTKGWQDFLRAPWHSLAYGAIFTAIGWLLVYLSWSYVFDLVVALVITFLIVGFALAFGLYDISQQLELKHTPTFGHERSKAFHEMGHGLMFALMLGLAFLMLLIIMSMVTDIGATFEQVAISAAAPISDAAFLLAVVIFAGLLFCTTTFALPMMVDQDAIAMTAIITSLHAVWRNKTVIALWALLILALMAVGVATALLGFLFIVPVIGYATWHAYRETIIAEK
jgi:uncharacterized membrane protein